MGSLEEWPNFPEDYLESRKHDIHVHLQILGREVDEIHEYLVHYQEPWISEGQLRKAIAKWKTQEPGRWRTVEELDTQSTISAMNKPDQQRPVEIQTTPSAVEDHHMQKTLRKKHVGLGRTMSSSANKNHQNQGSSVPRSLSLKKTLRESISDSAADFKANISPDLMKKQFANHEFAKKTHYKPLSDLLSPGIKRSNTALSPKFRNDVENGKTSPGHARSYTEQIVSTNTTFASGTVTPGQRVSDNIKHQFATISPHYKDPDMLSPPTSRENSIGLRSPLVSPRMELNGKRSPRHRPSFSFDQGNRENLQHQKLYDVGDELESPVLPRFNVNPKPPYNPNDRVSPAPSQSSAADGIPNAYDEYSANPEPARSNPLAKKPSYDQIARRSPPLAQKSSYDQIRGPTSTLAKKPSFDRIGRGNPTLPTILPAADGRYHADPPDSQVNRSQFPIRSSSLARKPPNSRYQPQRPAPPPFPEDRVNGDATPPSPDYGQFDAHDMRSQYSQSQYSQFPSQIRGDSDFGNFGLDGYPLPPPPHVPTDYKNTSNSNFSSSSVPLAMYSSGRTPVAAKSPNFSKPPPLANHPQALANYNQAQSDTSQGQYGHIGNMYEPSLNGYNESLYAESQDRNNSRGSQGRLSSSTTESQKAARRATVWDGANGFTDPRSLPIIEESTAEWEKERQREEKIAQERNFDFSSFLTDLTRI